MALTSLLDPARQTAHRQRNLVHSAALIGGMGALLLTSTSLIWSWSGALMAMAVILLVAIFGPRVRPETVMRLYRAEHVDPRRGGQLTRIVEVLADRAELPSHPRLYVIPSMTLNAFATGSHSRAAIAVTEGLLRRLTLREIAGVIAHEMSHIRNNDLFVMGVADAMTRFTQLLSYTALALALMNIPRILLGVDAFSWVAIALLYLSPAISSLLQLGLSRTREYDADLEAASLTGDPMGLASALRSLERYQGRFWEDFMFPVPARRIPQPSLLRSHPETDDRIRRLVDLQRSPSLPPIEIIEEPMITLVGLGPAQLTPRFRWPGLWY